MLKSTLFYILILTSLLALVSSCKKDNTEENSDYPITINVGGENFSWHKSDVLGEEWQTVFSTRIQSENAISRLKLAFSSSDQNNNWMSEIDNTEFEISGEWYPNFLVFELKESKNNLIQGVYRSKSGTIKVLKIKNNKIFLNFAVEMRHENTDEVVSMSGNVDGVSYVIQE